MKNDLIAAAPALEPSELSWYLLIEKYAAPGEGAVLDVQQRVSRALAGDEEQFTRFLSTQQAGFIPGGRINAAAGTDRKSTLINCFVQPIADSMTAPVKGMPGIMMAAAQAAETMRRGGGVGYDFSDIRPMSALVKGTNSHASGPVSFARVLDRMCDTVESAGNRRGAQMGVLRIDHPDVEEFITVKQTPDFRELGLDDKEAAAFLQLVQTRSAFGWEVRKAFAKLSNFNISVGVTDEFMRAVLDDRDFALVHAAEPGPRAGATGERVVCEDGVERYVYRRVRARDLWHKLMRHAYDTGDPGILFLDSINRTNNLRYCEVIRASNPCGEQMLPAYGCCDLGSALLTRFVVDPFSGSARFDSGAFARVVAGAVEVLDRVLDCTNWPLPEQQAEAEAKRRIGIGFTGLADAMVMMGLRYGSAESAEFARSVAIVMRDAAYRASVELAKKLGPFPMFDADQYLAEGTFASTLPEDIKADIRRHGIRNSHLLSVAPTGTISMAFGDNCSSGIEPIFALQGGRNVRTGEGEERKFFQADCYSLRLVKAMFGDQAPPPPALVTIEDLTVDDHLAVVAAVAPYIDSAISKTINVPVEYPFDDFEAIYVKAWKAGAKGLTAYRPNPLVGSVLVSDAEMKAREADLLQAADQGDADRRVSIKHVPNLVETLRWPSRPDVTAEGVTYGVRHPRGNFSVIVNHWENGRKHALECWVAGNEQPPGLAAIAKSLSVDMRTDDAAFVNMKLDSLLNTKGDDGFEMRHPATGQVVFMPSLAAGFAALVKHRLGELGALQEQQGSPMLESLFSRREPKTGAEGAIGWHVDINNPATGDDFLLHTKEIVLPDGTIRPYSVWLSGQYPKVLDGLAKVLSIDLRVSDPNWAAMKLRKLVNFGEVRGDFLASVPGEQRQQNYPSTVAYIAAVLLARMDRLGLLKGSPLLASATQDTAVHTSKLLGGGGQQCPECHAMALHKVAGCQTCSACGYVGSCG